MANNLFISYRTQVAEPNLGRLKKALESLGACIEIQEFFWYVKSNKSAEVAKEVLRDNLESGDTLIVIDASHNIFEMNRTLRDQVESRIRYIWE